MTTTKNFRCTAAHCGLTFGTRAGAEGHVARNHSLPGMIRRVVSSTTGTTVTLWDGELQGMDMDAGRWQTVCEGHGHIVSHRTLELAKAHLGNVTGWCEGCANGEAVDPDWNRY